MGTRIKAANIGACEKPLIKLRGITMVDRVLAAMKNSGRFERVVAIASPNAPMTTRHLERAGEEIFKTAGEGFSIDLATFLQSCGSSMVLAVPADLCLLDGKLVGDVTDRLSESRVPASSAVCSMHFVQRLGLTPSVIVQKIEEGLKRSYCHSGITLFDTALVRDSNMEVAETHIVIDEVGVAVNVNTAEELELAAGFLVQRPENLTENQGL